MLQKREILARVHPQTEFEIQVALRDPKSPLYRKLAQEMQFCMILEEAEQELIWERVLSSLREEAEEEEIEAYKLQVSAERHLNNLNKAALGTKTNSKKVEEFLSPFAIKQRMQVVNVAIESIQYQIESAYRSMANINLGWHQRQAANVDGLLDHLKDGMQVTVDGRAHIVSFTQDQLSRLKQNMPFAKNASEQELQQKSLTHSLSMHPTFMKKMLPTTPQDSLAHMEAEQIALHHQVIATLGYANQVLAIYKEQEICPQQIKEENFAKGFFYLLHATNALRPALKFNKAKLSQDAEDIKAMYAHLFKMKKLEQGLAAKQAELQTLQHKHLLYQNLLQPHPHKEGLL